MSFISDFLDVLSSTILDPINSAFRTLNEFLRTIELGGLSLTFIILFLLFGLTILFIINAPIYLLSKLTTLKNSILKVLNDFKKTPKFFKK